MTAEYLPGIIALVILIAVCIIIVIVTTKLESKFGKKNNSSDSPEFVVGRIYQMEDGSFAKYIGDGKFKKVKEMD